MSVQKSHKIAAVIIIIAVFLLVENTLLRSPSVFRYTGIQIYDAVREYRSLASKGFDVIVNVEGISYKKPVRISGRIAETYAGWFVMRSGDAYRIVEGPMGSKDVLANLIYFDVSPKISVEAVFEPEKTTQLGFKQGFIKVKGAIAFDDASIAPTLLQELRNLNEEFFSLTPGRIEIRDFGNGFILDIKVPVSVEDVAKIVSMIKSSNIQTGYMYYYMGVDDELDIPNVRRNLEENGAILVNYYKQR